MAERRQLRMCPVEDLRGSQDCLALLRKRLIPAAREFGADEEPERRGFRYACEAGERSGAKGAQRREATRLFTEARCSLEGTRGVLFDQKRNELGPAERLRATFRKKPSEQIEGRRAALEWTE